jgi:thioredoxin 1
MPGKESQTKLWHFLFRALRNTKAGLFRHPAKMRAFAKRMQGAVMVAGPHVIDVNEDDFAERVIAASAAVPVLVDFWADWCPPCRALTPVLERLVGEYRGRFVLAKIDADENMRLAGRYQLRGFPTVILFMNGQPVDQFSSARTPDFVRDFLDRHLDKPGAPGPV